VYEQLDTVQVPVHILESFKPEILKLLQTALDRGPPAYSAEHIFEFIESKKYQLFVAIDKNVVIRALMTTQINEYPLAKVLTVCQLASNTDIDNLEPMFIAIEKWAKDNNCNYAELFGRKGWIKASPGFTAVGAHMTKQLI
jgi:hypothetical protein